MNQSLSDLRAFRFRLRHDRLLRLRLRHARHQVTVELAKELGFSITIADLCGKHAPILISDLKKSGTKLGL